MGCGLSFTQHGHRWLWVPDRVRCAHLSGTTWDLHPSSRFHFQTANSKYDSAFPRRGSPELCKTVSLENRGRRECRALAAPIASRANKKAHERSHHRFRRIHPAFPAQWFYGLLRALPGDHALLTPSPALLIADLTPALGRQNDTTWPYAGRPRSSRALPTSIASRPAFVTIASRPSCGTGRCESVN
jgi:hypothetical protein